MIRWPASLRGRLLVGASGLILLALLLTSVAMSFALRRFIQGQVDGRLDGQILSVADALRVGRDGSLRLERIVDGPPFERPLSDWSWEVLAPMPVLRSTSLVGRDFTLAQAAFPERPKPETVDGRGPTGVPLRVRVKRVPVGASLVTIAAAAPAEALEGPLREALTPLVVMLACLGAVLLAGVVLLVQRGLRPLSALRAELALVRSGNATRIRGPQPTEIRPLVTELNSLLDQNSLNLERARRHVANLAHGLKTPLATLALALDRDGIDETGRLRTLVSSMDRRIRHHLARARMAAVGGIVRSQTDLSARIDDYVAVFAKLYADKTIRREIAGGEGPVIACEVQDLDEMLGNLLDNACKWARHEVWISTRRVHPFVHILIEDDGPGLAEDRRVDVMRAGVRIDESSPGYGFGLPIARELAELYGGSIELARSARRGLQVKLSLPAA